MKHYRSLGYLQVEKPEAVSFVFVETIAGGGVPYSVKVIR